MAEDEGKVVTVTMIEQPHEEPKSYILLACITFWLCNVLFGCIAIIFSCKLILPLKLLQNMLFDKEKVPN